ncbi:MAG: hypothetical protein ABI036_10710 [Fibrobacteria bacterium]
MQKHIAAISVGFAAAFFFFYPISDGDIFWHLAAGREIVRTHAVPYVDPFAFTSRDLPWTDLHWLFQVGMFGMQSLFGLKGVLIANSVLPGLAAGLLFFLYAPAKALFFNACFWIAALFEIRYLAPHRPIMASLLLLAAFICCLELFGRRNKLRYLACLFPLQVLWTNTQPLFMLGPAIVLAWLTAEIAQGYIPYLPSLHKSPGRQAAKRRVLTLAGALILLCLAPLANPYGPKAFKLAFLLFHRTRASPDNLFSLLIDENRSLPALFGTSDAHYAWATVALTALACVSMALAPRGVRLPLAFVAMGMAFLAFRSERNIILYFFSVLPLLSVQLPAAFASLMEWRPTLRRYVGIPALVAMTSLAIYAVAAHAAVSAQIDGSGAVAPFSFPDGSVAYLAAHPVAGNGFNADRHGGYLLWKSYPPRKVFIDTRYALRPDSFLAEYSALLDDPVSFGLACDRYGITYAILPTALVTRYLRLATALLNDPDWRLVYADGTEALFYKSQAAEMAGIAGITRIAGMDLDDTLTIDSRLREIRSSRWGSNRNLREEAAVYLAQFLERMGRKESAEYVYRSMDKGR